MFHNKIDYPSHLSGFLEGKYSCYAICLPLFLPYCVVSYDPLFYTIVLLAIVFDYCLVWHSEVKAYHLLQAMVSFSVIFFTECAECQPRS